MRIRISVTNRKLTEEKTSGSKMRMKGLQKNVRQNYLKDNSENEDATLIHFKITGTKDQRFDLRKLIL